MLTAIRCYCYLVFRTALRPSIPLAQLIIAIIIVFAETAIWFAGSVGVIVDADIFFTMLRSPSFLVTIVASVIAFRFVCAQYWIWTEEHDARTKAELQVAELSASRTPPPNTDPNALSVDFLRDDLHEIPQILAGGTLRRTINVSTLNRGNG